MKKGWYGVDEGTEMVSWWFFYGDYKTEKVSSSWKTRCKGGNWLIGEVIKVFWRRLSWRGDVWVAVCWVIGGGNWGGFTCEKVENKGVWLWVLMCDLFDKGSDGYGGGWARVAEGEMLKDVVVTVFLQLNVWREKSWNEGDRRRRSFFKIFSLFLVFILVNTRVPLDLVWYQYSQLIKHNNSMPHHFSILLYFKIKLDFKTIYTT